MYSRMDLILYDARKDAREEGREEERAKSQKELDKKQARIAELEERLKMYEKSA